MEDDLREGALEVAYLRLILPVGEERFSFANARMVIFHLSSFLLNFHLIEVLILGVFRLLHGAANLLRIVEIDFAFSFLQLLDNLLLLRELPMPIFGDLRANLHVRLESRSDLRSALFPRQG